MKRKPFVSTERNSSQMIIIALIAILIAIIVTVLGMIPPSNTSTNDKNNSEGSVQWRNILKNIKDPNTIEDIESANTEAILDLHKFIQDSSATQVLNIPRDIAENFNVNNKTIGLSDMYLLEVGVDSSPQMYKGEDCPRCNTKFTLPPYRLTGITIKVSGDVLNDDSVTLECVKIEEITPPCMECYASLAFEEENINIDPEKHETLVAAGL